jgi:hypothetical protein
MSTKMKGKEKEVAIESHYTKMLVKRQPEEPPLDSLEVQEPAPSFNIGDYPPSTTVIPVLMALLLAVFLVALVSAILYFTSRFIIIDYIGPPHNCPSYPSDNCRVQVPWRHWMVSQFLSTYKYVLRGLSRIQKKNTSMENTWKPDN